MVGAILTQNTAWVNVEKAIANLKQANCLTAKAIHGLSQGQLATMIRPSGYYNIKAKRLKAFSQWYLDQGGYQAINRLSTTAMRVEMLGVYGVGEETADDMILYAFHRPVFVIDAYTRRIFSRLGIVRSDAPYTVLQERFVSSLPADSQLYAQYHALIVNHAKHFCRKNPICIHCPLATDCKSFAQGVL